MFAKFDENPAKTLQKILKKQNVTDARTHGRTHGRTDNVKTVYPPQTKFAGGIRGYNQNLRPPVARNLAVRHTSFVCLTASFLATVRFVKFIISQNSMIFP